MESRWKSLDRSPAPTWQALYTLHWDKQYAYWFRLNPEETHLVLDAITGQLLLREQSLIRDVDYRSGTRANRGTSSTRM